MIMTASVLINTNAIAQGPPAPFKPFVMVDLTDPVFGLDGVIQNGTITNGWTVGAIDTDPNSPLVAAVLNVTVDMGNQTTYQRALFFDPRREQTSAFFTSLDPPTGYPDDANTVAVACSQYLHGNAYLDDKMPYVVGYITNINTSNPQAAYWQWDDNQHIWKCTPLTFPGGGEVGYSVATDVNDDEVEIAGEPFGTVVGYADVEGTGQQYKSFYFNHPDASNTTSWIISSVNSLAFGVSDDPPGSEELAVVGRCDVTGQDHWRAYFWQKKDPHTFKPVHPDNPEWSQASAINVDFDVAGWSWPNNSLHKPAKWTNYDPHSYPYWEWVSYTFGPGVLPYASGWSITNEDIEEILISFDDETSGAFIWKDGAAYDLDALTLKFTKDPLDSMGEIPAIHHAYSMSDRMVIGASFLPTSAAPEPMPCIIVPYDTDNNGVPDFREILESSALDANGRMWLLDQSEQLRVGLHAPPVNPNTNDLNNQDQAKSLLEYVRTVRFLLDQNDLTDPDLCNTWTQHFALWGNYELLDTPKDFGSEILLVHRSRHPAEPGIENADYIPPDTSNDPDEVLHDDVLRNLFDASLEFAYCIDYIQLGNEMFGRSDGNPPPGAYYFDEGTLDCDLPQWGYLGDLEGDCLDSALDMMLYWLGECTRASVYGSAIGGRPLRIYTPALTLGQTFHAIEGNVGGPYGGPANEPNSVMNALEQLIRFANQYQAIIDQHTRYVDYSWVGAVWSALLNGTFGELPDQFGTLETAPHPTQQWKLDHIGDFIKYYDGDYDCSAGGVGDPAYDWNLFLLLDWEPQFENGFQIADVFNLHNNVGALHALYGPYMQNPDDASCSNFATFHLMPMRVQLFNPLEIGGTPCEQETEYRSLFRCLYRHGLDQYGLVLDNFYPHYTSACQCQGGSSN
ncbi:MAG: hypothetical protein D8M59_01505 [Planctomycetes bacterium]|nr:hypothetical protein [Planctomycetota bacterium]